MKATMYPARLELEILRENGWVVEISIVVNNDISLFNKYQYINQCTHAIINHIKFLL